MMKSVKSGDVRSDIRDNRFIVGIDPGFGGTGVALFENKELKSVLWLKNVKKQSFVKRGHQLARDIDDWIHSAINKIEGNPPLSYGDGIIIVCEIPAYQNTPSRSMGWKKGDLQKLTYLVGAIGFACSARCYGTNPSHNCTYTDTPFFAHPEFITISPAGWKGQLSKQIVIDRIRRKIDNVDKEFNPKLDIWDAIGIGLWALEEF
jgi:hypothetical protein